VAVDSPGLTNIMDSNFSNIDVVNGRGQGVQRLPGNVTFRKLVSAHKRTYAQAPKSHKVKVAQGIVTALRRIGAKFLEFDTKKRCYYDIGDEKAVFKTGQALREGQVQIKRELAAEAEKGVSSSGHSSFIASSNQPLEESYANHSIQILQSLRIEDEAVVVEDKSPSRSQSPRSTKPKQSSKSASHEESKSSITLGNQSGSDTSIRAILDDKIASESESSVQLLSTTNEEINDILEEMAFDLSEMERDAGDIHILSSMSLGDDENVMAKIV